MSEIEREHTCENCYYEEVDGYAYPCNRCSHNKPTDDMWQQRSKSMSDDEVAELLKNIFGDECACNYNGIDEWLPECCKYVETGECPDPKNNGCWKQFIAQGGVEHIKERAKE